MKRFQAFAQAGPPANLPRGRSWSSYMDMALTQASLAAQGGEVPVGAIIINSAGELVACAGNNIENGHNPCGHAEILAICSACQRLASSRLTGHILIVTLEPCLMCAGAIAHSRLDGVVFGAYDAQAGALVSIADRPNLPLAGRSFWHLGGVEAERCSTILCDFFTHRRSGVCHA